MSLIDLLAAGKVDEFNAQRGQRRRIELFASDLAGVALVGIDLSNAVLEKSDFTGSDLTDSNLAKADFSGIDGNDLKLCDATAVGSKWREAILEGADLSGADLSHGDLAEADLSKTKGSYVKLSGARLRDVNISESDWSNADLSEARLHKANLSKAKLESADLTEATANEANFEDANLENVIALRAKLQQANFTRARLVGARLEEAQLQGANLTGANLERADLRRANLTGAVLDGANLRGANLTDAVLEGVNLVGFDLSDVDLTGIDPRLLGLSEDQLAGLAAVGSSVDANAPLKFSYVAVARDGAMVAVLWENHDSDETLSLRWAISANGQMRKGVLPISAEGVMARAIVPLDGGFSLFVLQERPGGAALLRYLLSHSGELGTARTDALGYEPGVRPVFRVEGGEVYLWGLARRGPTLVVQKYGAEGLETVHSKKLPTARGFLGGHHPVLACKGGVLISADVKGAADPLRTPPSFPGPLSAAVTLGDRVLGVWSEPVRGEEEPGGMRFAWMGPGVTPKPLVLTKGGDIAALDAIDAGDAGWVAWAELGRTGADSIYVARLPGLEPQKLAIKEVLEVEEVRFAYDGTHDNPRIAVVTADEGLRIYDLEGSEIARWG